MIIDPTTLAAFRWMPEISVRAILSDGTETKAVGAVVEVVDDAPRVWWPDLHTTRWHNASGRLRVVDTPGSRGCLLQMVREALGLPHAYLYRDAGGWLVADGEGYPDECNDLGDDHGCAHSTEFDALVAALAAAPVKP